LNLWWYIADVAANFHGHGFDFTGLSSTEYLYAKSARSLSESAMSSFGA
jgi:hypothetical protein